MIDVESTTHVARHVVFLDVLYRLHCILRHAGRDRAPDAVELLETARARLRATCAADVRTHRFIEAGFRFPHKRARIDNSASNAADISRRGDMNS